MVADLAPPHVRQVAREILKRPEYARWRTVEWETVANWLKDKLDWVFEFLSGTADVSPLVYYSFWIGMVATSVLLLAHIVWTVRTALQLQPSAELAAASSERVDLSAAAEGLARRGRFVEASHYLYLACLEQLLDRGLLQLSRSDPNRTLRRRVRQSALPAAEAEQLCTLLDRMETAWFRTRQEDPELYAGWRALLGRLQTLPLRA